MTINNQQGAPGRAPRTQAARSGPWWRYGLVWMVIGGPASVVLACIVTAFIILSHPEVVIAEDYYRRGLEINKELAAAERDKSLMPAEQPRDLAAAGAPVAARTQRDPSAASDRQT
jgi:hypothetical protein